MTTAPKPPLVYRLAAAVAPLPKRGIEEAHRSIINRLRRYSATSIVDLALHMMWNPPKPEIEELRSAPWLTLLLVKWALQDNRVSLRVGPPIPQGELDRLRQQLWELQGTGVGAKENTNVWLMLRSILHVQIEFQRPETWGFLRWPALYARLDRGSTSRRQFREVMGMEPDVFIDLAYALYAAVLDGKMPLGSDWLSPWRPAYGAAVDRMYELFVRDLLGLRAELQGDAAQRIRGKQELYEFPYLRRFPFLRLRDGTLHCWHPLVFARGLDDAVHLRLSQLGKEYIDSFSLVFERYVTELAIGCGMAALDEAAYKESMGANAPSVEVILEGEGCNIFVEAKMSLFADDVVLQDNQTAIFNKTKRVREGIKQGWRVGGQVRDAANGFGSRFAAEQDFLLLVTSRDLVIGGGNALQRLYEPGAFDYPDEHAKQRLPLSNIFILSIDDFENTMGCVAAGEVNLSVLLKESAVANQNGQSARMLFSDFLGKYTTRWSQSLVLREAREAAEARVFAALGGNSASINSADPKG
ncbi:GapS1 family protein [Variovorax sp. LT2P21]|uniref:GapS1 family protein n=1 Tax=Variovorax sp. LT2P21 TaxID=3443731 RepID=UPI003F4531DD